MKQLSRYVLTFPVPDDPDRVLLYSTKTGDRCLLSDDQYTAVRKGGTPDDLRRKLVRLGMLVHDREEERLEVFDLPAEVSRKHPVMHTVVIPGRACNFRCLYCPSETSAVPEGMDEATADRLIAFLMERYTAGGRRQLVVDFYGGEPLLYVDRIRYLAAGLRSLVEKAGSEFAFSLTTNGALLAPQVVAELLPLGLETVRITVDGPAEVHDRHRPFASGRASFETVVRNVLACCNLVRMELVGNFTPENYQRFPELLDYLAEVGVGPDRLEQVRFLPAPKQGGNRDANTEFLGGCRAGIEPWLTDASLHLREEILKRGYPVPEILSGRCMVTLDDALAIDYDGAVYKCAALAGQARCRVGDVRNGIHGFRQLYHPDHWIESADCRDCVYLPLCFGGCRYQQFRRYGNMAGVDCRKLYLKRALREMALQDVRYGENAG